MKPTVILLLAVLALTISGLISACSSRPRANEEDKLYADYGGDKLLRKRTESRQKESTHLVWNNDTHEYDKVSSTKTVTVIVLEIEKADGTIVDKEVPPSIGNKLREGEPIPALSDEQAAAAGIVGNCVKVNKVVLGGAADDAGMQDGDLIISYNGQKALGSKKLAELIQATTSDQRVKVVIERDGTQMQLDAAGGTLGIDFEDEWR